MAGFLAITRLATWRERLWLAVTASLSLLWVAGSGGIADQVVNAMAVLMTGAFIALSAADRRPGFTRAAWSVLVATGALVLWSLVWDIRWPDIELALTRQWWEFCRNLALAADFAEVSPGGRAFIERMADAGRSVAQLFPARLVVSGILGLVLAAWWHQKITNRPLGRPVGELREFRFTDQLIWLVIAGVAVLVIPEVRLFQDLAERSENWDRVLYTVQYWAPVALNLLLVCAALYAARGAAVIRRLLRPGPAIGLAVIATMFLLPFALAGLAALGVADTWVDFRKRIDLAVRH
ncbi:MAG TPA: hypothetical protein VJU17_11035 [Gemmatimonadales bacterium]|nr:hypothetical protein [Gemmatimonadales bacterium]